MRCDGGKLDMPILGEVIAFMGTNPPTNFLACDGSIYANVDYPELAAFFNSQYGDSAHFGGASGTSFAVPDLRGNFLRGTGSDGEGTGEAMAGDKQKGTKVPYIPITQDGKQTIFNDGGSNPPIYMDGVVSSDNIQGFEFAGTAYTTQNKNVKYGIRPNNTSVMYCICCKGAT